MSRLDTASANVGIGASRGFLGAVFAEIRPLQWTKNAFVLAPLFFSLQLFDGQALTRSLLGTAAFCFAASSIYVLNDVLDVEADRAHPDKRNRPIASGELSISVAWGLSAVLAVVSSLGSIALEPVFGLVILAYLAMNVFYSLHGKKIVILDVMLIAAGFVLRVYGGTKLVGVSPSKWILICTSMLALFLGFTKRKRELCRAKDRAPIARDVLSKYSHAFLDQMINVATAGAVMSYALYTVSDDTVAHFGTNRLIYTVPFVIYGVYRYLYLTQASEHTENPAKTIVRDSGMLINFGLWVGAVAALIYL